MSSLKFLLGVLLCFTLVLAQEAINYNDPNLDLNNAMVDYRLVNWEVIDQANVPAERVYEIPIDRIKVEQIGDKSAITTEQWEYENNLNYADDLSKYEPAQQALIRKHSLSPSDFSLGRTTYLNGKITNQGITLELNDPLFSGSKITSLAEGGFSISKGTASGKFKYLEQQIDLTSSEGEIKIRPDNFVLPLLGILIDSKGNVFTSLSEGTEVSQKGHFTSVSGVAHITYVNGLQAQVGTSINGNKEEGSLNLDSSTSDYQLDNAMVYSLEGKYSFDDGEGELGEPSVIVDAKMQKKIVQGIQTVLAMNKDHACGTKSCTFLQERIKRSAEGLYEPKSAVGVAAFLFVDATPNLEVYDSGKGNSQLKSYLTVDKGKLSPSFKVDYLSNAGDATFKVSSAHLVSLQGVTGRYSFSAKTGAVSAGTTLTLVNNLQDPQLRTFLTYDTQSGGKVTATYSPTQDQLALSYQLKDGRVTSSVKVQTNEDFNKVAGTLNVGIRFN